MSEEQLNAFLKKVKGDTSLQDKLKAASTPEAVIEIAKEAGFLITAEDMQSSTIELSDEELEGAAGGGSGLYGCPPVSNTAGDCAGERC